MRFSAHNLTREKMLVTDGEVATGLLSRLRGLIGHEPLRAGEGLLIRPCQGVHTFGMSFPIDLAYANANAEVLHVASRVPPNHLGPIVWRAAFVLELPSGTIDETVTRPGDKLGVATVTWEATAKIGRDRQARVHWLRRRRPGG